MAESNSTVKIDAALGRKLLDFKNEVLIGQATNAEQSAKANAPWKDQTGDARRLLKGIVIDDGHALGVAIAHRVEYGKNLETVSNGRFAILKPTIESIRSEVYAAWREFWGGR